MSENKRFCTICGKERPKHYIEFLNQYMYINCECETAQQEKEQERKQNEAIETYIKLRTQSSHVQPRYAHADLYNLTIDKNNKKAIEFSRYISDLLLNNKEKSEEKNGLIFKGNVGSGKTFISCAIINEYNKKCPLNESTIKEIIKQSERGFVISHDIGVRSSCKIIKEDELISLYGKSDFRTEALQLDEYKKAQKLLVIDDSGTSCVSADKIKAAYFNIIDYRYSNKLPVIITTNMNNAELRAYLSEQTYDRLNACCFGINLTSDDSRRNNS